MYYFTASIGMSSGPHPSLRQRLQVSPCIHHVVTIASVNEALGVSP
jgi:hypothetical protein